MTTLSDPENEKSPKVDANTFLTSTPNISLDVYEINKSKKNHVNLLHLKNKTNPSKMTIVYCHGNSSCLGKLYPSMIEICSNGEVDVIAVEYPGYGTIKGTPTDLGVIKNVMTAYDYIVNNIKIDFRNLVFYGQSLGCGPVVLMGSHPDYPCGGIITESPFVSGLRLFNKTVKKF